MSIVFDGNFSYPREVEGSPRISVDEITHSRQIVRRYAQLTSNFTPLSAGSRDNVYQNAVLISESMDGIQGPLCFFTRTFNEIPGPRTEARMVSFTLPGVSRAFYVPGQALPASFDKYGYAAPSTRLILGSVAYSYSVNSFQAPPVTQILYHGNPVDFVGEVYIPAGTRSGAQSGNNNSNTQWKLDGVTDPPSMPVNFILSVNVTRWRGPIFQMEVVSTSPSGLTSFGLNLN